MDNYNTWLKKQRKMARTEKRNDLPGRDLHMANINLVRSSALVMAAFLSPIVRQHVILQVGASIGALGVVARYAAFRAMYANERVYQGRATVFDQNVAKIFRNTPLQYFSAIKLASLQARELNMAFINELKVRLEVEQENRVTINKDIKDFTKVSVFLDPFYNLKIGGLSVIALGIGLSREGVDAIGNRVGEPTKLMGRSIGLCLSLIFAAAEIGVFTTKRKAAGDKRFEIHPIHKWLLTKGHQMIMASPLLYLSWGLLRLEARKIRKLELSDFVKAHLDERNLTPQLQDLLEASRTPKLMKQIEFTQRPAPRG